MRLLLIEDEYRLADALVVILQDNKYCVDVVYDGESGRDMALTATHDVIILDRMLPKMDGISVLKEIRNNGIFTPVLLLTAKDTVDDRVCGLDAGADDYLVKPFATKELLARIRALSRRMTDNLQLDNLKAGSLELDILRSEAMIGDRIIKLTFKEASLLELFLRKKGNVISKEQILDNIWGVDSSVEMNNIEIYIHYLRKKIPMDECGINIETIRGIGYTLKEN